MLNLSAAQRRKALAARVLELSGGARLGKGERYIVEKERKKAAKHVREGLLEKQKAREKQELEEVSIQVIKHVWHWLIHIAQRLKI